MPENFDNVYTIEAKTSKGWEVIYTAVEFGEISARFRDYNMFPEFPLYRLTTPKIGGLATAESAHDRLPKYLTR